MITDRIRRHIVPVALLAMSLGACAAADAPASLPKLNIDPARIGVAGLSSGVYMATQAQMAWPGLFSGVALTPDLVVLDGNHDWLSDPSREP